MRLPLECVPSCEGARPYAPGCRPARRRLPGGEHELAVVGHNLLSDAIVKGLVLSSRDITEKKKAGARKADRRSRGDD